MELLEQGRSVLWTQALNLRTDLTRLAEKAPDLAERLDEHPRDPRHPDTRDDAVTCQSRAGDSAPVADRARQSRMRSSLRRRMAREWDEVLAQVRALDGFEHFLAAIPYAGAWRLRGGRAGRDRQREPSRLPRPDRETGDTSRSASSTCPA